MRCRQCAFIIFNHHHRHIISAIFGEFSVINYNIADGGIISRSPCINIRSHHVKQRFIFQFSQG